MVLVGLASKNAILIVEFAKHKREAGLSRREATLEACKLRLRPILMTSFAFILGVVPLMVGHGAGAEMRRTLGIAVFSGMLGVTLFGIFLTPVFFYVIEGFVEMPLFAVGADAAGRPGAAVHRGHRDPGPALAAGAGCWAGCRAAGPTSANGRAVAGGRSTATAADGVDGDARATANGNGNGHEQGTTSPVNRDAGR